MDDYPVTNPLNIPSDLVVTMDSDSARKLDGGPAHREEVRNKVKNQMNELQDKYDTLYISEMALFEMRFIIRKVLERVYNYPNTLSNINSPCDTMILPSAVENYAPSIRVLQRALEQASPVHSSEADELFDTDEFAPVCRSIFSIEDTPPFNPQSTYIPVDSEAVNG